MHIAILGAGQAGLQTVISLRQGGRQGGFDGDITLIGDEGVLPYQRPPLSKAYLSGKMARERLFLKPQGFFEKNDIHLELGRRISRLDPAACRLHADDGFSLGFDRLVICTGSRPRYLDIPGRTLGHIFDLRSMQDVDTIRPQLMAGKRLAIVGGGYIGLETAAVARARGLEVSVLEAAPRLLARVAEAPISEFYTHLHESHGVSIQTGCKITAFESEHQQPHVSHIRFADDSRLQADLVITGIGILPNIELAAAAGIAVSSNGIEVDDLGRTSIAHIYAAGDCTYHPNDVLDRKLRLESVPNAIEQAKAVASDILGAPQPYHQVPWFWSDQYDVKLQIAGLPAHIDTAVLRGDVTRRSFAYFYFTGSQLTGVTAVNRAGEFMAGRKLILAAARDGVAFDKQMLADETMKPKDWVSAISLS